MGTTYTKGTSIPYAPTAGAELYPETDGKPMAASDDHRRLLILTLQVLETYFKERPEVYISGDILMYYREGYPQEVVAPDVLVTFGIGQKSRRTYKVWEEGKVPDFVMEFSSKSTYRNDLGQKMELYASLGIQDYFLYDAEGLYLPTPLMGFTLEKRVYAAIPADVQGRVHSSVLGLDFHLRETEIAIYDPVAGEELQTQAAREAARAETAETQAAREAARAETAETQAAREAARAETAETRAEKAEAEVARLREALARSQALR